VGHYKLNSEEIERVAQYVTTRLALASGLAAVVGLDPGDGSHYELVFVRADVLSSYGRLDMALPPLQPAGPLLVANLTAGTSYVFNPPVADAYAGERLCRGTNGEALAAVINRVGELLSEIKTSLGGGT
jgi:hypothetical protein